MIDQHPEDLVNPTMKNYIGISRDHSASMRRLKSAAMKDYNVTIAGLTHVAATQNIDTIMSVVRCGDGHHSRVAREVVNSSIAAVSPLSTYQADAGGTPLFDSVGELITMFESVPDAKDPNISFIVMAITDGEENDSRIWRKNELIAKIRELENTDRWTFVFRVPRGYKRELVKLGIHEGNILEWDLSDRGVQVATQATNEAFERFYEARKTGVKSTRGFYTTNLTDVNIEQIKAQLIDVSSQVNFWTVTTPYANSQIRDFCEARSGGKMLKGAAFYRLDKREEIQEQKQIAIRDNKGTVYVGPAARDLLGLPHYGTIRVAPGDHADYIVYVQSTSVNRKLPEGTQVMYWPNVGKAYQEGRSA